MTLISVETRLRLIAASAGLPWTEVRDLTFIEFAKRCATRRRRPRFRVVPPPPPSSRRGV